MEEIKLILKEDKLIKYSKKLGVDIRQHEKAQRQATIYGIFGLNKDINIENEENLKLEDNPDSDDNEGKVIKYAEDEDEEKIKLRCKKEFQKEIEDYYVNNTNYQVAKQFHTYTGILL